MEEVHQVEGKVFVADYVLSNGLIFSGDSRTPISALIREIFQDEVYATAFHGMLRPVVLDLGANVGVFALWASMSPRCATVYAVEPVPSSFSLLRKNLQRSLGGSAPRPLQAAISKTAGDSILYLDRSASCDTLIAPPSVDLAQRVIGTIVVDAPTLADVYEWFSLGSCDVLKLDVEGSECDVLSSASDDDLRRACRIIVETHDYLVPGSSDFIRRRLESAGFEVRKGAMDELLMAVRK